MSHTAKTRKLYHNLGYVTVFTYFRFFHAPYSMVEALVPKKGKIVDLGSGYGFFSNMLGIASDERKVIGIELNGRKIKYADKSIKNVEFINKDITKLKLDDCDAVVLFHVLHHLSSYAEQHRIVKECYKKLKVGGKLIVVEIDYRPLWKFLFTLLIDSVLYIGDKFYYRSQKQFVELFNKTGLAVRSIISAHRFVPLSHIIYISEKI
jgi:SAM-dependent methyltransferase